MTPQHLETYRKIILSSAETGHYDAAALAISEQNINYQLRPDNAIFFWRSFVRTLLEGEKYATVAKFLWGPQKFTVEPSCVKTVWDAIPRSKKLLVLGSGKLGKSYTFGVWNYLDWIRDPYYTSVKIISASKAHASSNLFAHILSLHQDSIIPMEGIELSGALQIQENNKRASISVVSVSKVGNGEGVVRGFPPWPRKNPHKKFGDISRLRLLLDEAEFIPEGIWKDIDNMLLPTFDNEHVKVFGATNPEDNTSEFANRARPVQGWEAALDFEEDDWISDMGWDVLRLDASKFENVVQKKVIYPGFQTYEGYQQILSNHGSESATFYTMCRGMYPPASLITVNALPSDYIDRSIGEFNFTGRSVFLAGVDLALEGGDEIPMTVGRVGLVSGYTDKEGKEFKFDKERYGIQVLSQMSIHKGDTFQVGERIKDACDNLSIENKWLAVDRTGIGEGIHDWLLKKFGDQVVGINFSEKATDLKIMEDSQDVASDQYDGIITEMMYSVRKFMEFHYLKISPGGVDLSKLKKHLSKRKARPKSGRLRLESKKDYKSREGESPDRGDSLMLAVHLVRMRSEFMAFMIENTGEARLKMEDQPSIVDNVDFIDFLT